MSNPVTHASFTLDRKLSVSLCTLEFEADGEGTLLTLTEEGVYFTEEDQVAGRKEGTEGLLDALQAYVEGLQDQRSLAAGPILADGGPRVSSPPGVRRRC